MFTSIQTALATYAHLAKQPGRLPVARGWHACTRHESRSVMNSSLFGLFGLDRAYVSGPEGHT